MMTERAMIAIIPPPEIEYRTPVAGGRTMRLFCLAQALLAVSCTLQGCGKVGKVDDAQPPPKGSLVGSPAPEIAGEDLDGEPMRLSDYRGKVVLLSFYAEWCKFCVKQFPHEKALVDKLQGRPFVLLGVNGDDTPQQAKHAAQLHGLSWRSFFIGRAQMVPRRYRLEGWPTFVLIDPQGKVRHIAHEVDRELEVAINVLLYEAEQKQ
jgi:thiol-disulfide isomerase/thioredoxin